MTGIENPEQAVSRTFYRYRWWNQKNIPINQNKKHTRKYQQQQNVKCEGERRAIRANEYIVLVRSA